MDESLERQLDEIVKQGIESNDVSAKDQLLMIFLATLPFILATFWYLRFYHA